MKKKIAGALTTLVTAVLLAGCGSQVNVPLNQMKVEKYVTLGDYANLQVKADAASVDPEELEALLNDVYLSGVTAETGGITDRAVAVGDIVVMDYEGKRDGVAFAGGTAQGARLTIGSGQFIDGFEDGLVGVMPGETVDLDLRFPEGYKNADLAGQAVVFTVTVHYIVPGKIPVEEMQDLVAASLGVENVSTVEGLNQYLYDYLYSDAQANYNNSVQNGIMGALMECCTFGELPEELVEDYREMISESLERNAAMYGSTADSYAMYAFGMTKEEVINTYAEETLKQDLAMQAVANAEGLAVSDEELQSILEEQAAATGYGTVEEYMGNISRENYRNFFMNEKVMEYLVQKVTVTENE